MRSAHRIAQAGFFFHQVWPQVPRPLELAFRAFYVDGDPSATVRRELSWIGNWFFHAHRNKLTLDLSRLGYQRILDGTPLHDEVPKA